MKICLDAKGEKKKRFKFFSIKFFLFCFLVLMFSIFFGPFLFEVNRNVDLDADVKTKDYNIEPVYNLDEDDEEKEERKKETLSKIEEVVGEVPNKDFEVLEGYSKEVNEYIDNVLFLINFIDATFRLSGNDIENIENYLLVADETANVCIYYLGEKDIVPRDILGKIEDSEKIAKNYCNSVKKYSSLVRGYWNEDDGEKMVFLLKELREHYEDVEVKAYVLKRMCKELEGMVF
jgi:hypothetical protein